MKKLKRSGSGDMWAAGYYVLGTGYPDYRQFGVRLKTSNGDWVGLEWPNNLEGRYRLILEEVREEAI